ncbi:MAG TPA: hypothetical protein ENI23_14635 [bacterium]|nr:hypothetical protein [bacterium]
MEIKEKIMKTLTDFGRISTSRVAGIVGIDYNYATKILNELHKAEKVLKQAETNSTYWMVRK